MRSQQPLLVVFAALAAMVSIVASDGIFMHLFNRQEAELSALGGLASAINSFADGSGPTLAPGSGGADTSGASASSSAAQTSTSAAAATTSTAPPTTTSATPTTTTSTPKTTHTTSSAAAASTTSAAAATTSQQSATPTVRTTVIIVHSTVGGSTVAYSSTSVTTSTPTAGLASDQGATSSGGMTDSQKKIAIGVGVGVGGAILLGVLGVFAWRFWGHKRTPIEEDNFLMNDAGMEKPVSPGASPFKSTLDQYHNPAGRLNTASNF